MSEVYVVVKLGVYRHEIIGVWADEALARKGAEAAIATEKGDYHCMELVRMPLGTLGEEVIVATLKRKMKTQEIWEAAGPDREVRRIVKTAEVERQWWE